MEKRVARSLPVRERGLKLLHLHDMAWLTIVAPRAGAWIEAEYGEYREAKLAVAPRAGAWIEAVNP